MTTHRPETNKGISKFLRVTLILHLCFVFTLLAWEGIYAFSKESLAKKSQLNLFEYALAKNPYEQNATLFHDLPSSDQQLLEAKYNALLENPGKSFVQKIVSVFYAWTYELSPWFQAWIFFSLLSAFLIFFQIKGVQIAIWVLPLTIIGYAYYHHFGAQSYPLASSTLIPTEDELVQNYLETPLSKNISEQKKDLENAWKLYLVDRWSHERASEDPNIFEEQAKRGYYLFAVANLKSPNPETIDTFTSPLFKKAPLLLVVLYFVWNCFLAAVTTRERLKRPKIGHEQNS